MPMNPARIGYQQAAAICVNRGSDRFFAGHQHLQTCCGCMIISRLPHATRKQHLAVCNWRKHGVMVMAVMVGFGRVLRAAVIRFAAFFELRGFALVEGYDHKKRRAPKVRADRFSIIRRDCNFHH